MFQGYIKMAVASLKNAKWRSVLAASGIIVGIASVITIVSLGEGVKREVITQLNNFGSDLIIIRPGKSQTQATAQISLISNTPVGSLSKDDWKTIDGVNTVGYISPLSFISSNVSTDERELKNKSVIGTTVDLPNVLNQKVEFGSYFGEGDSTRRVAIIGNQIAKELFQENAPMGRIFSIRGEDFVVRGVFEEFMGSPIAIGIDLNSSIFIPYETSQQISLGGGQITQILAKPNDPNQFNQTAQQIYTALLTSHNNQEDFSVLTQTQSVIINTKVIDTFTSLIAGIAAISLIVGGIGIMNIMLVAVSERTREIGIRKAVGATNKQLLGQFLIEAMILSIAGGVVGILLAYFINYCLHVFSNFTPVITWPVVILATGVSLVVGIVFGITPALRAAHKDPIDALRYE